MRGQTSTHTGSNLVCQLAKTYPPEKQFRIQVMTPRTPERSTSAVQRIADAQGRAETGQKQPFTKLCLQCLPSRVHEQHQANRLASISHRVDKCGKGWGSLPPVRVVQVKALEVRAPFGQDFLEAAIGEIGRSERFGHIG